MRFENAKILVRNLSPILIFFGLVAVYQESSDFYVPIGRAMIFAVPLLYIWFRTTYKAELSVERQVKYAEKGINLTAEQEARNRKYFFIVLTMPVLVLMLPVMAGASLDSGDFNPFFIVAFFLLLIGIASTSIANQAEAKGKSYVSFFWLSIIFSPLLTWLVVSIVPAESNEVSSNTKLCPKCAETIKQAAILCKHCGSEIG